MWWIVTIYGEAVNSNSGRFQEKAWSTHYIGMGGVRLANIKSAKKRIRIIEKKTLRNKMIKSKVKTLTKKVNVAIVKKDKPAADVALKDAVIAIDKARSKGIYHKNNAARKVSKLTLAVNKMA